jgi:polysaccharide pyruvyl transferase WcaK-like protein
VRILVEPAAHAQVNLGDIAMLQTAVSHLRELWPNAAIGVITATPERLATHCPDAVPVSAAGREAWLEDPLIGSRVERRLPGPVRARVRAVEEKARRRLPSLARSVARTRKRLGGHPTAGLDEFLEWVSTAGLVVVNGAGLLTDAYARRAITVLALLETAARRGASTAMMGQGVGPLTDVALRAAAARVLPTLDLIGLRESRSGPPILSSLGVPGERMITTGDEAIEQAVELAGPAGPGNGIGVNVRVARYSAISPDAIATVGRVVRRAAERHGVDPVPVPISFYAKERDADAIARMLGTRERGAAEVETPAAAIERAGRCRVVITGSYHAAVFALAQGIPAVGLAGSGYYVDKFLGLAGQFGGGCATVRLDEPRLEERLEGAIEDAWSSAPAISGELRQSAERQVEQVREAYQRLHGIVARRGARAVGRHRG